MPNPDLIYIGTYPGLDVTNDVHVHQRAPSGEDFSVGLDQWSPYNPASAGWEFWEVELPQPHGPGWTYEIQTYNRESDMVTVITVPEPDVGLMLMFGVMAVFLIWSFREWRRETRDKVKREADIAARFERRYPPPTDLRPIPFDDAGFMMRTQWNQAIHEHVRELLAWKDAVERENNDSEALHEIVSAAKGDGYEQ